MLAITAVVVSFVVSCRRGLDEAEKLDINTTPLQTVIDMLAVQTENGKVSMRVEADVMKHFDTDSASYDTFPTGISFYGYSEDGLLESVIVSDEARHIQPKKNGRSSEATANEIWEAFGNVVLHNIQKRETMETDTIYWDQTMQEVYTDCYVKMYSPDGFTQGYGMRSDDHIRNAILHRPFDGYALVVQDTTAVIIDSVNFIGPFPKK